MKRASLFASAAVASLLAGALAAPVFAQGTGGPFADVPVDHWAYKAVDTLQKDGIVIGYPDGTYGGKRAMTRYEFAVAIARLIEKIPSLVPPPPAVDLSDYVKKEDLAPYALKSDLAGFAQQSDVDALRKLVNEFQTELTTLGVDLDATKHRLDALEGRVNAIETEMKRVKIGGDLSIYARGNNTFKGSSYFTDADGFKVPNSSGSTTGAPKNTLYDTNVLHDGDITVKARLSSTATVDTDINYGNFLPYNGSIASFSNQTTQYGRATVGGQTVDQAETFNVYKAVIDTPIRIPGVGGTDLALGRIPLQLTPYTFKLIDVDSYFYNAKTSLGDIPVDGGKLGLKLGGLNLTGFAAKTDPISFVSDENSALAASTGDSGYGLFAGAFRGPLGSSTTGLAGAIRPTGSSIVPTSTTLTGPGNGAMFVEEVGAVRATADIAKVNLGATYEVLGGYQPATALTTVADPNENFNRVFIYGVDGNTALSKLIGIQASYTKSDTKGPKVPAAGIVDIGSHSDITKDDDAFDGSLSITPSTVTLTGGYTKIGPYFGAPGYWDKLGSWTNPTDIEGPYVKFKWAITNMVSFNASGKFYEGTGEADDNGGLYKSDKVTNAKAGFKFGLTAPSALDLGVEETRYKLSQDGGQTPTEYLVNVGYGYAFTPASSIKFGYQWVNYVDGGVSSTSGFGGDQRGGVATTQFTVKF